MHAMRSLMARLRAQPVTALAGRAVESVADYLNGKGDLPPADVLTFCLTGGAKIMIRPSGTEPKIKLYLTAVAPTAAEADALLRQLAEAAEALVRT